MTRTGVTDRLKLAAVTAATRCPQMKQRHISPHIVRHATAMNMLQSGVDITVIALWLGHESTATTHMYYLQKVDMCSWCPKSRVVNVRAWLDSA